MRIVIQIVAAALILAALWALTGCGCVGEAAGLILAR